MNEGLENEKQIIAFLDGKELDFLRGDLADLLSLLFSCRHGLIHCEKAPARGKPDCVITIGSERRFVSLKSGSRCSAHTESLVSLIPFFREIGVSESVLKTIVYFHFGDGTLSGDGPVRFPARDIWHRIPKQLIQACQDLKQIQIVRPCAERFIFSGANPLLPSADAVYHGDVLHGVYATHEEFLRLLPEIRTYNNNKGIGFGPFTYQPAARNLCGWGEAEKMRKFAEIKWLSCAFDLGEVMKRKKNHRFPFCQLVERKDGLSRLA
jgi:hypothetical protein